MAFYGDLVGVKIGVECRYFGIELLDRSQNYAFIWHLVAFHFICITFAFHLHFA